MFNYDRDTMKKNIILVTNEDVVYCFGRNFNGVLGFGHQNRIKSFFINQNLSDKQIIQFNNSDNHTIARTINGNIYYWGYNRSGYLGNGNSDEVNFHKPEINKYLLNENIDISCGSYHTLVLTLNGEVYAWGGNYLGQIGNGLQDLNGRALKPFKVDAFHGEKIKSISCGSSHSMALTENGRVFSWGSNFFGKLGIENEEKVTDNYNVPKIIKLNDGINIDRINCGKNHSLLLSREKDVICLVVMNMINWE